jgi:hypothetical protein
MMIKFAAHAAGWQPTKDGGCYGIFPYANVNEAVHDDESEQRLISELEKNASEVMGKPLEYIHSMNAGDFVHGSVMIIYMQPKGT